MIGQCRGAGNASLRTRLMLGAAIIAIVFMAVLLSVLQRALDNALERVIEQRLAADASTLISSASLVGGRLSMPKHLPHEEFNIPDADLLGYIYDSAGQLVWRSRSAEDESIAYRPRYEGGVTEFVRTRDGQGREYFVFDVEITLPGNPQAQYSFLTMQSVSEYRKMQQGFRRELYPWLGGGLLLLLLLLWLGLTWGFRSLRGLREELDRIESGQNQLLSEKHPREMLRLTRSLNRLLENERQQRARYSNALADLAHSLKTPLAVVQSVGERLGQESGDREQARLLNSQIERMSQQIDYQLRRAALTKSGLIRHRVALAPLLDRLCATLDKVYREKGVIVERRLPEDFHVPMEAGPLMEVLGNLLENAYRLCLHQVSVEAFVLPDQHLQLNIEDDGPGIPALQRERILRRGVRLDALHPGQGIGLAVVKDILDSYGAQLSLGDSALGGACFSIILGAD